MTTNSILFLDIDGVLVTRKELQMPYMPDQNHMFNLTAMDLLNKLIQKTNMDIVISSTWRLGKRISNLQITFIKRGFLYPEKIIGMTSDLWKLYHKFDRSRGDEIQDYLDSRYAIYGKTIPKYVILDDDSDMLEEQKPYFVQTEFETGFLEKHYDEIVRLVK